MMLLQVVKRLPNGIFARNFNFLIWQQSGSACLLLLERGYLLEIQRCDKQDASADPYIL